MQSGFSLLSVMVALGISIFMAAGISTLLTNANKGSASLERRIDREQIRSLLLQSISCDDTLKQNSITNPNSTSQCGSTSSAQKGPYLHLTRKTSTGWKWLGGSVNSNGSRLGDWWVRASCSASEQSLVVRIARAKADGSCCGNDPLTGKPLDWDHPSSLLFGGSDKVMPLCYTTSSDEAEVITQKLSDANQGAGVNCNSSFENVAKLYAIASGSAAALAISPKKVYTATILCPSDKKVIAGGAQCGSGFAFGNGLAKFITNGAMGGNAPGSMVASQPTPDGKGWMVACCIEGKPTGQSEAYAVCK